MDMIVNVVYATICTIIVISPFVYFKYIYKPKRRRIIVYNSPPTKRVGNKTGAFVRVK